MRFYHSFLVAAAITIISSAAWADSIKMLPPSDFEGDTCAGTKIGILQWDGANPIRCVPNFTGDKDGNVGVKTKNPAASLHVMSRSDSGLDRTLWLQATDRAGTGYNNSPGVLFLNSRSEQEAGLGLAGFLGAWGANNQIHDLGIYSLSGNVNLGTSPNGQSNNVLARVTVTPSGNVGIGTTTPQAKLDVSGEARVASSGASCSAANAGAIRFDAVKKAFAGCDGTAWNYLLTDTSVNCQDGEFMIGIDGGKPICKKKNLVGGAFELNNDGSCRYKNPYTNVCTCPHGYTAFQVHEFDNPLCSLGMYADGWRKSNCGVKSYICVGN